MIPVRSHIALPNHTTSSCLIPSRPVSCYLPRAYPPSCSLPSHPFASHCAPTIPTALSCPVSSRITLPNHYYARSCPIPSRPVPSHENSRLRFRGSRTTPNFFPCSSYLTIPATIVLSHVTLPSPLLRSVPSHPIHPIPSHPVSSHKRLRLRFPWFASGTDFFPIFHCLTVTTTCPVPFRPSSPYLTITTLGPVPSHPAPSRPVPRKLKAEVPVVRVPHGVFVR